MKVTFPSLILLLLEACFHTGSEHVDILERPHKRIFEHEQKADDVCHLEDKELPDLQVVFLVDASLPSTSNWPIIQREMTKDIMKMATEKFTVEFALTAYQNFDDSGNVEENCYSLLQPFTKDPEIIMEKLNSLPGDPNHDIDSECTLTLALLMTVADKKLAWNHELFISTRKPTRKVIMAYPLKVSFTELDDSAKRREPLGDGTDTCKNSNPPQPETLQRVLVENNVIVVMGLFEIAGRPRGTMELFYFDDIFPRKFEYAVGSTFVVKLAKGMRGFELEDIEPGAFVKQAGLLFRDMLDEVKLCYWEDPPQYITLGL